MQHVFSDPLISGNSGMNYSHCNIDTAEAKAQKNPRVLTAPLLQL